MATDGTVDAHDQPAPAPVRRVAPVSGEVVALHDVPDEVFAEEIVGPGLAIEPRSAPDGSDTVVQAPVSGTVGSLYPHAFAIERPDGRTVLVHLGIDTVALRGEGFELHVASGDEVTVGQTLITWDPDAVAAAGYSTVCVVIALQGEPDEVDRIVEPGQLVQRGDDVVLWR
jgi:PTS system glucose-specific IIA component